MNRIRLNTLVFSLFVAMVLLNSCETALTTSWGTMFKRDPKKVSVSASNVNDLLKGARGDTELSKAIFDKTVEKAKTASGQEKAVLQTAAITAAKQATALDLLIMDNIGDILKADSETDLKKLLNSVLDGARGNHIVDISEKRGDMFKDDVVNGAEGPRFKDPVYDGPDADTLFIDTVTETDLVNLIITILLGKAAQEESMDDYLNKWGTEKFVDTGTGLDAEEKVAVAAYNLLKDRGNEGDLYNALHNILEP
jgi:hypothetical protein